MATINIPNYQVQEKLYESSNSIIYRAQTDNKSVILKNLKNTSAEGKARLQREFDIIKQLETEQVIKVIDLHEASNTLILDDSAGIPLDSILEKRRFEIQEFLEIGIQIAQALSFIHSKNFIHKDINPSNIVWNPQSNEIKIIDFGITTELPRETTALVHPTSLEGTLNYISPEQTGRMNRAIDYRSDLYSLGITFYQMLTQKLPFEAEDVMEIIHSHIARIPAEPYQVYPNIPKVLSDIIMKLLAKTAEDRYLSAVGLKRDLEKCLEQWKAKQNIDDFTLASKDISLTFNIPQKLFGREAELDTLLQAFDRISQGKIELMLVAGYSGTGKTMLVHEVHKPMTEKRGYFITGKFDQYQKNIPYYGWIQTFSEFVDQLLTEDAESIEKWKQTILAAVGNIGKVITDLIPQLEHIIGEQPEVPELHGEQALNRFNYALKAFVSVISTKEHPLIIFIDDWQWADSASLSLFKMLLTDANNQYLLIIAAYRNNEVNAAHPFSAILDSIQESSTTVNKIELKNLNSVNVAQIINEATYFAPDTMVLSKLVFEKTQGNAFFVTQFLKNLYEEKLLSFDSEKTVWTWDIETIRNQNITDNVVELMTQKIQKLPKNTQVSLKLASCIGNRFDLSMLCIVAEKNAKVLSEALKPALQEGLIIPLSNNYRFAGTLESKASEIHYQFIHDRIQQAVYGLIPDKDKQKLHFRIGELILQYMPKKEYEENIFSIINHLEFGVTVVKDTAKKISFARLYLMAGQKAKNNAAYTSGLKYLQTAMHLLPADAWNNQYSLTLNIYNQALEAAFLSREYTVMEEYIDTVVNNSTEVLDKVTALRTKMLSYNSRYNFEKAIETGLELLENLNFKLPMYPSQPKTLSELLTTALTLRSVSTEELANLPSIDDRKYRIILDMMDRLNPPAFIMNNLNLYILFAALHVKLAIKKGVTPESNFILYAVVAAAALGFIKEGYDIGQAAIAYHKKTKQSILLPGIQFRFNGFVRHLKDPLRDSLEPMLQAYYGSLEVGNLEDASYSLGLCIIYHYVAGFPLQTIEALVIRHSKIIQEINQNITVHGTNLIYEATQNLLGKSQHPIKLKGTKYDEDRDILLHREAKDGIILGLAYFIKSQLNYLFGNYIQALGYTKATEALFEAQTGTPWTPLIHLYGGLTRLALYKKGMIQHENMLKQAKKNIAALKKLAKFSPDNQLHRVYLLEAELEYVTNNEAKARDLYDKAIELAEKNQYIPEKALACELAGRLYVERNQEEFAKHYLNKAYQDYISWGAATKVQTLEKRYGAYIDIKAATISTSATTTIANTIHTTTGTITKTSALDIATILKASQTLAGEIELKRLLDNLLNILIENAGAQRGLLLLSEKEQWVIQGEKQTDQASEILQAIPLENAQDKLAINIVQYVLRTHKTLVLDDAVDNSQFNQDNFIKAHNTHSLLCAPLINQGKLSGILYLENNLATSAFTQDRVEILQMLSTQAAISLENAVLYDTLEQKVEERTEQLAQANDEITKLNEQLKSENLRMGAELDVSRQLQQMLLPKTEEIEEVEQLDIAAYMTPADEVGGDYYDVIQHENKTVIGIGDVTGHGLESGVLAIMVQVGIRTLIENQTLEPKNLLKSLNAAVYANTQRMDSDKNMTLSVLYHEDKKVTLFGQHEDLILVKNNIPELIDTSDLGFPIGFVDDIEDFVNEEHLELAPGDGIVLYTDGITEAENSQRLEYGIDNMLEIIQANWDGKSAQEVKEAILKAVYDYIGDHKIFDDITLVVLKQR